MTIQNAKYLIERNGINYRCSGNQLPSKMKPGDYFVLQRGGTIYRIPSEKVGDIQDNDWLVCTDSDGKTKKISGARFKTLL